MEEEAVEIRRRKGMWKCEGEEGEENVEEKIRRMRRKWGEGGNVENEKKKRMIEQFRYILNFQTNKEKGKKKN